jgi:hypothetical protein
MGGMAAMDISGSGSFVKAPVVAVEVEKHPLAGKAAARHIPNRRKRNIRLFMVSPNFVNPQSLA